MNERRDGWRRLRVDRRVRESEVITSLHLVPDDATPLPAFAPGQFLTFRIPDGKGGHQPRNYSLSGDPADAGRWRISVKREPGGLGSGYMHDAMAVGAIVEALGPKGRFTLAEGSRRPVILLAGGVGITPLLAMAHRLASDGKRAATIVHACENGRVQAFRSELAALALRGPALKVATVLANPDAADRQARAFDFEGLVSVDVLRSLLPIGDYEAYLCGPPAFMQAMHVLLVELGVREENIAREFFGPENRLGPVAQDAPPPPTAAPVSAPMPDRPPIRFARSGREVIWDGASRSLLDFAEAQGLTPAFSCRNGICNTCICAIEGAVRYIEEPLEMPGPGLALLCCSVPDGPVTLEL
jgi:ferredoxin-NADP reductase